MKKKLMYVTFPFFILISICLIPFIFSIFRNVMAGAGSLITASWNVALDTTGNGSSIDIVPGSLNGVYTINVSSNSEVDVTYSIIVSDLPQGVQVSLDSGGYVTPTNNTITFSSVGVINYSDVSKQRQHILTFKANQGTSELLDNEINIDVKFQQLL